MLLVQIQAQPTILKKEHINGSEYADYLKAIVKHYKLNIRQNEKVLKITAEV